MSEDAAAARRVVIVGGGIAGLSIAHELKRMSGSGGAPIEVVLLEKSERPGGNIRTEAVSGFLCEWGPNGFLDNAPDTLALIGRLGVQDRVQVSDDAARKRFIFRRGRLREVPGGVLPFLKSDLLSWPGKLRIAAEPFARRRSAIDETIHEFAARRIGVEAAEVLIASMVSGVFAGDARRLSLAACFPRMRKMEDDHGGLVRAMLAMRKAKRRGDGLDALAPVPGPRPSDGRAGPCAGDPGGARSTSVSKADGPKPDAAGSRSDDVPAGPARPTLESHAAQGGSSDQGMGMPAGRLTSFRGGMEDLIRALAAALGSIVRTGSEVRSLSVVTGSGPPGRPRYVVHCEGRDPIEAGAVVLTGPAGSSGRALAPIDPELASLLAGIESAPIVVVCLGYDAAQLPGPLDGFGFLVPPGEGPRILGALWDSSIYPGRAASGKVLIRAMIGGARDAAAIDLGDPELLEIVRGDLRTTMNLAANPVFTRIFRHPLGIPQYTVGHLGRLSRIGERLDRHPGLYVAGNSYRGISINSCISEAGPLACRIAAFVGSSRAG